MRNFEVQGGVLADIAAEI